VPPLSGFFSKDEILAGALAAGQPLLFATGVFTAGLTAFYIARAWLLAFVGAPRWAAAPAMAGSPGHDGPHAHHGPRESPPVMIIPLLILAVPAVLAGLLGPLGGHWFGHFVAPTEKTHPLDLGIAAVGTLAAAAGLGLAWLMYGACAIAPQRVAARLQPLYVACAHRWWVDEVYAFLVRRVVLAPARLMAWFDTEVIDAVVNATGAAVRALGRGARRLQSGSLPAYGLAIYVGVVIIALVVILTPR
jgi:NADH-quinone oxidoreductase subunit L